MPPVDLVEATPNNGTTLNNPTPTAPAPAADSVGVDAVDPPDLPAVLGTMADLIEHSGLHHSAKFADFVGQVRAFQRSINGK